MPPDGEPPRHGPHDASGEGALLSSPWRSGACSLPAGADGWARLIVRV